MTKFQCSCSSEKTDHEFVTEKGDYNEIYVVKCAACGIEHDVPRKEWLHAEHVLADQFKLSRAFLTKYPRIEPHTGEVVNSREHEKEVVRKMGFHEAPHGVNDRFTDELGDKLRKKYREIRQMRDRNHRRRSF